MHFSVELLIHQILTKLYKSKDVSLNVSVHALLHHTELEYILINCYCRRNISVALIVGIPCSHGANLHVFSGMYQCPVYYYPNRGGEQGRQSFVLMMDVKIGEKSPDHWIRRGVAALLSLDY